MLNFTFEDEGKFETERDSTAILASEIFKMYALQANSNDGDWMEHVFSFSLLYEMPKDDPEEDDRYLYDLERLSVAANMVVSRDHIPRPLGHLRTSRRVSNVVISVSELSTPSPSGLTYCNGIIILPVGVQHHLTDLIEAEAAKVGLTGVLVRSDFHSPEDALLWLMQGPMVEAEKLEGFISMRS